MKLEVKISKNNLFVLIGVIFILAGMFAVYAYNTSGTGGSPSNAGHSVDEMDWSKKIPVINLGDVYYKDGMQYYPASYYIGVDNNGNDDPDCWFDGGEGGSNDYSRVIWGGCNQNISCCVQTSLSRKKTALNNAQTKFTESAVLIDAISLLDYTDTGGSSSYDSSSDKILVNVWLGYNNSKGLV